MAIGEATDSIVLDVPAATAMGFVQATAAEMGDITRVPDEPGRLELSVKMGFRTVQARVQVVASQGQSIVEVRAFSEDMLGGSALRLVDRLHAGIVTRADAAANPPAPPERDCPWCAERIKLAAIVCKHCGRDVPPPPPPTRWQRLRGYLRRRP